MLVNENQAILPNTKIDNFIINENENEQLTENQQDLCDFPELIQNSMYVNVPDNNDKA